MGWACDPINAVHSQLWDLTASLGTLFPSGPGSSQIESSLPDPSCQPPRLGGSCRKWQHVFFAPPRCPNFLPRVSMTLQKWLITQNIGVIDPFLKGQKEIPGTLPEPEVWDLRGVDSYWGQGRAWVVSIGCASGQACRT